MLRTWHSSQISRGAVWVRAVFISSSTLVGRIDSHRALVIWDRRNRKALNLARTQRTRLTVGKSTAGPLAKRHGLHDVRPIAYRSLFSVYTM
jgi:hypothetical protein